MELYFRQKCKCDRMLRSKSFDTQEFRKFGQKEAVESKGFSILWMGIIEGVTSSLNRDPSVDSEPETNHHYLGQWRWTRRALWQPREILLGRKGSRKTNKTPQGTWLGGARAGSLRLCYARPVTGRPKSGIAGSWRRPKPTPSERNSWGS